MAARKIMRSVHEGARDMARDITTTDAYLVSRRQWKKVEMLFAHLKCILKLDRLRLRGPNGAKDEFHLVAAAQNLREAPSVIAGVHWRHRAISIVPDHAGEQGNPPVSSTCRSLGSLPRQLFLHRIEQLTTYVGLVLARVDLVLVPDLADVDVVLEKPEERTTIDQVAAGQPSMVRSTPLACDAFALEFERPAFESSPLGDSAP